MSCGKQPNEVSRRIVLAGDADRRELERELHGGVQQHLVALAVSLQLAEQALDSDPEAARPVLGEMRGDVQRAIDGAALLAQRIYPAALELGSLVTLLRSAAVGAGVPVSVDVEGDPSVPPEIGVTVYLCWLALLAKSDGGTAAISVRESGGALAFELVGQDGAFDGLQARVEALGGNLTIEREAGGVRLSGSLPRP